MPQDKDVRLEKAVVGPRSDVPLIYDSAGKRFMAVGGALAWRSLGCGRAFHCLTSASRTSTAFSNRTSLS